MIYRFKPDFFCWWKSCVLVLSTAYGGSLCGQSNVLPAGGTVANTQGKLDFSLGQIEHGFYKDSMVFMLYGVQQPQFSARVDSLDCKNYSLSKKELPQKGTSYSNILKLSYRGGNGKSILPATFNSSQVAGLTLALEPGKLSAGAGFVNLKISGIPDSAGIAKFAFRLGGKSCTLEISVEGPALDFPNFFSPNNDGIQDVWTVPALFDDHPEAIVRIFDRTGKLIVTTTKDTPTWDGTLNGTRVQPGVYWVHILVAKDKNPITGYLTLIR